MTQPTKEQVKELWERCGGVLVGANYNDGCPAHFVMLDGKWIMPPETIDLNNLFKYAVPKLWKKLNRDGEAYKFDRIWKAIIRALLDGEDISDAVFWVIWEVINDRKE